MKTIKTQDSLLNSIRVLDLSGDKGPLCGKILGDLGADVVLVEKPGGDPARDIGPFYKDTPDKEKSLRWYCYNTSKRGITLNLENAGGATLFKKLAAKTDFIIESFAPGYLQKLGLDYQNLSKLNPGLIMISVSPFGQEGPYSQYKGTDLTSMAMSGLMYICGYPDRAPLRISVEQTYALAGVQSAAAAMIAYTFRQKTGAGQQIDISFQNSIADALSPPLPTWFLLKQIPKREGTKTPRARIAPRVVFPCADGLISWRIIPGVNGLRIRALVEWMDTEGMAGELLDIDWVKTSYRDMTQEQVERWEDLFSRFFMKHTIHELHEGAVERGIFIFPVSSTRDLANSTQLKSRNFWTPVYHPELKEKITYPGAPYIFNNNPWKIYRRPPLIGEHNEEVFLGELNMAKEDFASFKHEGII